MLLVLKIINNVSGKVWRHCHDYEIYTKRRRRSYEVFHQLRPWQDLLQMRRQLKMLVNSISVENVKGWEVFWHFLSTRCWSHHVPSFWLSVMLVLLQRSWALHFVSWPSYKSYFTRLFDPSVWVDEKEWFQEKQIEWKFCRVTGEFSFIRGTSKVFSS